MATDRDDRLARLESEFDELDPHNIASAEELDRAEAARAARHFGFAQPVFRTSVTVRFTGEGVVGHDLNGVTAAAVVGGLTEVVEAAGAEQSIPSGAAQLFLSPNVRAGSTILELFGAPAPATAQETLDTEVDDSPTDVAVARLFELLDSVNAVSLAASSAADFAVGTRLGNKLFALSNSLIDAQVDLSLGWTRPRGARRDVSFARSTAHGLRAFLDMERVETIERVETGTLTHISTDGTIGFNLQSVRSQGVTIVAENLDAEVLRALWARTVVLSWTEVVTSHPRRTATRIVRTATGVHEA